MAVFKCKMCGGELTVAKNSTIAECEYCGTKQTVPAIESTRREVLYDRASHFLRNCEYDKAMSVYEQILNEKNDDAEAYWSLVLCRFGVVYVDDPSGRGRIPTINRIQYTSVFSDENYIAALKYADREQRAIYEKEADCIHKIQKGYLEISRKASSFDVFICYKESDNGERTIDSVIAQDIYNELTREGFRVFFSRITLADKLGTAYEPYIFSALNSAKVMIVLGTKRDHFDAVWVKNEWSRFLSLIKNGEKKTLIPVYRDMTAYDMPDDFLHLQALDISKIGAMQDLVYGIKKIIGVQKSVTAEKTEDAVSKNDPIPLLKRACMFLEDGDFSRAAQFADRVLNIEPENPEAYLVLLMSDYHVRVRGELKNLKTTIDNNKNYQKAIRFGDEKLKAELRGYSAQIKSHLLWMEKNEIYQRAVTLLKTDDSRENIQNAKNLLATIPGFRDSDLLVAKCQAKLEQYEIEAENARIAAIKRGKKRKKAFVGIVIVALLGFATFKFYTSYLAPLSEYSIAVKQFELGNYLKAAGMFEELGDFKDSKAMYEKCIAKNNEEIYNFAVEMMDKEDYREAIYGFDRANGFSDSREKRMECMRRIVKHNTISAGLRHTVAVLESGDVVATGDNSMGQCNVGDWKEIVSVAAGDGHTVGLCADGTVVATGNNEIGQCDVSEWRDIVSVAAGSGLTMGLCADGSVVAAGNISHDDFESFKGCVYISAGTNAVGVLSSSEVVFCGYGYSGIGSVTDFSDIIEISEGYGHLIALDKNGGLDSIGSHSWGQIMVEQLHNVKSVSCGGSHTIVLLEDGSLYSTGDNRKGQCNVNDWRDVVYIEAGYDHSVAILKDGRVVATGDNENGQCNVSDWRNVRLP